jgi:hypothetical protein
MNQTAFRTVLFASALTGLFTPSLLAAQQPGNLPETKAPAPALMAPATPHHPDNDYWRKHDADLVVDFGGLARYKEADLALALPAAGENRVVFMGDSITDNWHFEGADGSFPGKPYINRGIGGQTTSQMLVRFRQDVVALKPKVVVILAGWSRLRTTWPRWPTWPRPTTFAWCCALSCRPSIFPGRRA